MRLSLSFDALDGLVETSPKPACPPLTLQDAIAPWTRSFRTQPACIHPSDELRDRHSHSHRRVLADELEEAADDVRANAVAADAAASHERFRQAMQARVAAKADEMTQQQLTSLRLKVATQACRRLLRGHDNCAVGRAIRQWSRAAAAIDAERATRRASVAAELARSAEQKHVLSESAGRRALEQIHEQMQWRGCLQTAVDWQAAQAQRALASMHLRNVLRALEGSQLMGAWRKWQSAPHGRTSLRMLLAERDKTIDALCQRLTSAEQQLLSAVEARHDDVEESAGELSATPSKPLRSPQLLLAPSPAIAKRHATGTMLQPVPPPRHKPSASSSPRPSPWAALTAQVPAALATLSANEAHAWQAVQPDVAASWRDYADYVRGLLKILDAWPRGELAVHEAAASELREALAQITSQCADHISAHGALAHITVLHEPSAVQQLLQQDQAVDMDVAAKAASSSTPASTDLSTARNASPVASTKPAPLYTSSKHPSDPLSVFTDASDNLAAAGLQSNASSPSPALVETVRSPDEIWRLGNKGGDFNINFNEFCALAFTREDLNAKVNLTPETLRPLFDEIDRTGDPLLPTAQGEQSSEGNSSVQLQLSGLIRLSEYCVWVLRENLTRDKGKVIDLFRKWDADGSGAVDAAEFGKVLRALGFKCGVEVVRAAFSVLDLDGGGTIEYKELDKALKAGPTTQSLRGSNIASRNGTPALHRGPTTQSLKGSRIGSRNGTPALRRAP